MPTADALDLAGPTPPTHLFHYTSVAGFRGIVRSRAAWATEVRYLNDSQEFRHAIQMAGEIIQVRQQLAAASSSEFVVVYGLLGEVLRRIERANICVFSLSETGDLLSQWRGYCPAGSGYSMGFDANSLRAVAASQGFFLAPCVYKEEDQRKLIERALENTIVAYRPISGKRPEHLRLRIERILPEYFFHFARAAATIKHPSFSEEKEWRLISGLTPWADSKMQFREGGRMIIPYIALRLQDEITALPVTKIIVGPTTHPEEAVNSAMGFWAQEGAGPVEVQQSQVPYRLL